MARRMRMRRAHCLTLTQNLTPNPNFSPNYGLPNADAKSPLRAEWCRRQPCTRTEARPRTCVIRVRVGVRVRATSTTAAPVSS